MPKVADSLKGRYNGRLSSLYQGLKRNSALSAVFPSTSEASFRRVAQRAQAHRARRKSKRQATVTGSFDHMKTGQLLADMASAKCQPGIL